MADYEFFYGGTPYSLEPTYGEFVGYRIPAEELGAPTSIQTANQLQETSNLLNQGAKTIELQPISPEVFDQIPKQHFKEINRLKKLTGAETTVHAPLIEPSGFTKEGWSETEREAAERQLRQVVDKSHELSPEGNMPITVHAAAIPGTEWAPSEEGMKEKRIVAINQESKQLIPIGEEKEYFPGISAEEPVTRTPTQRLDSVNDTEWVNKITNLAFYKKEADEVIGRVQPELQPFFDKIQKGEKLTQEELMQYSPQLEQLNRAHLFLDDVNMRFRSMFDQAAKFSEDKETKKTLSNVSKEWQDFVKKEEEEREKGKPTDVASLLLKKSRLIDESINKLREIKESPKLFVPVEDFAKEHTSKTFANVALHAFEKYGDKAPIVSVENLYSGMAFSRSEDLKKLIDEARDKFVEEAVKKGHSKSAAEKFAKGRIGVTWDVGHLNMMRKAGFKEKDIIKESERIAPYVKHVHLTDNFGYSDAHLPPGMGNVPTKEILEKLEKGGFKGKKIVEAGGFVQHFKTSPTQAVLEAFGSPLYSMAMAPYWNQIRATYGSYMSGYGQMLPEQHFSIYGAGFSGMPAELGGEMPGRERGRLAEAA